jgi:hypothetical protein
MTDQITVALTIVAAIWARENARSASFEHVNRIRDRILMGMIDGHRVNHRHRELMYKGDWIPLATGVAVVSFLFAVLIATILFLIVLCSAVFLYQLCDGIGSAWTLFQDSRCIRRILKDRSTTTITR